MEGYSKGNPVKIELTFEQVYYDQLWAAARGNSVQFLIKEIVDDYLKELNLKQCIIGEGK